MTNEDIPEIQSIWDDARRFIERGDYNKATKIYKYILIRYSNDPIAIEYANAYLGDIFLTLRQLDTAEDHIKKAISCKSEKPGYHYILGFIYSNKRQWYKAIAGFEVAVTKEPGNGEYLLGLAWAVYSSGDVVKGLASLERSKWVVSPHVLAVA